MFKIDPTISIYVQIADQIRLEIFSKRISPGSKLSSIRERALQFEVNPNTMQRVYQELEEEGLIYSNGNIGTFVVDDENFINHKRDLFINKKLQGFIHILHECHLCEDYLEQLLKKVGVK